jgi:proteasome lid subunit RPN8/RPN11
MTGEARVVIRPSIRHALVEHARRASPEECCGLLIGGGHQVLHAVPSPNIASQTSRYQVDDRLHLELRRLLRKVAPETEVVGAYHSHPASSAWPSARDIDEAFSADWLHVIVGLGGRRPMVRAFRIVLERVQPVVISWRAGQAGPAGPSSKVMGYHRLLGATRGRG